MNIKQSYLKLSILFIASYVLWMNIFFFLEPILFGNKEEITSLMFIIEIMLLVIFPIFLCWGLYQLEKKFIVLQEKIFPLVYFFTMAYILYVYFGMVSDGLLVPWDNYPIDARPQSGSFIKLNNFFERGIGSHLLSLIILLPHILLVLLPVKKGRLFFRRMKQVSEYMTILFIAHIAMTIVFGVLLYSVFVRVDVGYTGKIVPMLFNIALFIWYAIFLHKQLKKPYEPLK